MRRIDYTQTVAAGSEISVAPGASFQADGRVQEAFNAIDTAHTQAREAVDAARAASATLAIATALALLIGAFSACAAAVFGGRERDGLEDRLLRT